MKSSWPCETFANGVTMSIAHPRLHPWVHPSKQHDQLLLKRNTELEANESKGKWRQLQLSFDTQGEPWVANVKSKKEWVCIVTKSSLEEVYWERILKLDHELVFLDDWLMGDIAMPFEQWIAYAGNGFFEKPRVVWCSDLELLTRHAKRAEVFHWYQHQSQVPVYVVASRGIAHQEMLKTPTWLQKEARVLVYDVHSNSPEPTWGTLSNDDLLTLVTQDLQKQRRWFSYQDWEGPLYSFPVLLQAYMQRLRVHSESKKTRSHESRKSQSNDSNASIHALIVRNGLLPEEYVSTLLSLALCHGFESDKGVEVRHPGDQTARLAQVPLGALLKQRQKAMISMDPVINYEKRIPEVADVRSWRSHL